MVKQSANLSISGWKKYAAGNGKQIEPDSIIPMSGTDNTNTNEVAFGNTIPQWDISSLT